MAGEKEEDGAVGERQKEREREGEGQKGRVNER